jgi:hypothetical protein
VVARLPGDAGETLADRFRAHAADLEHLYGFAMRGMAEDWEAGGPAALLAGLFDLVTASGVRRIRLLELGASAGLNLLLDYYTFRGDSWLFGPSDSKVQFVNPVEGPVHPERFVITRRACCDLNPVDATAADGRLLLTSFIWPFDLDRHKRFSAALAVATMHPVRIDKASASKWLPRMLAADQDELPVVWHSITQMYWPIEEVAAVESILTSYGAQRRLGEVSMEFDLRDLQGAKPEVRTRLWSPNAVSTPRQRMIGTAHHHGVPVTLVAASP